MHKKITHYCSAEEHENLTAMSEFFNVKMKVSLEFCLFYHYGLISKKTMRKANIKKAIGRMVSCEVDEVQYNKLNLHEKQREKIGDAIHETFNHFRQGKLNFKKLNEFFPHI